MTDKNWQKSIPKGFCNCNHPRKTAGSVGELKEILSELPDDLLIEQGSGEGTTLIVYNVREPEGPFLSFEESDYD